MRTAAHLVRTLALGTLAIPCSLVPSAALGAGAPAPAVSIPLPLSNLPQGGMVVSDTLLAYDLPDPPMHASDANNPFTNFHDRVFVVTLRAMGSGLAASTPRLIFTLPRGLTMTPWSINGGWLVYTQYSSTDPAGPWTLAARDIATGTVIALDSPAREGVPSAAAQAASDGRTVVWQSWTQADGRATSVIRSYDLTTGRRRLLAEGGSQDTWSYAWPGVSGQSVVFEKEMPDRQSPRAQILLADLATGRARPLTPATTPYSEPSISGGLVVWKNGWRYAGGQGVTIYDVRSGARRVLSGSNVEQPKVTAGRYVIFPTGNPFRVQLYDAQTRTSTILAAPQSDGAQPGNVVLAGGHMVAYSIGKLSATTTPLPRRLVVTLLP